MIGTDPTGRSAGQYARATVLRLRMRTLVWLGVLAVATAGLGRAFGLHSGLFIASEIALLMSMLVISRQVLPLLERRDRGASAEEYVGGILDGLAAGEWRVIHDATLGRGNVDHILVGPGGVFTIETKSHPGPVRVGKLHGATLRQALAERVAIEKIAGVEVEALLVFSRAWVDRPLARRRGVRVLPARMLIGYLKRCPQTLSELQTEEVHERIAAGLADPARGGRRLGVTW